MWKDQAAPLVRSQAPAAQGIGSTYRSDRRNITLYDAVDIGAVAPNTVTITKRSNFREPATHVEINSIRSLN
jgi:hypothetical protein